MNEREKIIRLWFDMWIKKADLGIDNIFTDDVVYPEEGRVAIFEAKYSKTLETMDTEVS